jgi:hypothetical protein
MMIVLSSASGTNLGNAHTLAAPMTERLIDTLKHPPIGLLL